MGNEQIEKLDVEAAQVVHAGGSAGRIEFKLASGLILTVPCDMRRGLLAGEKEPEPAPPVERLADWTDEESAVEAKTKPGASSPSELEEEKSKAPEAPKGKLPAEFPYHGYLEAGGVTTFAQLAKRIEAGTLTEIKNIGDDRAAEIAAAYETAGAE